MEPSLALMYVIRQRIRLHAPFLSQALRADLRNSRGPSIGVDRTCDGACAAVPRDAEDSWDGRRRGWRDEPRFDERCEEELS